MRFEKKKSKNKFIVNIKLEVYYNKEAFSGNILNFFRSVTLKSSYE